MLSCHMPPWIEYERPDPFLGSPLHKQYNLDGDTIAQEYHQEWVKGKKYPLITFPSQLNRELILQPDTDTQIHVFGALDLPFNSTRDEAFVAADSVKDDFSIPFSVQRHGERTLVVTNSLSKRSYWVEYNNDQRRIADIRRFPQEAMELLPDELRAVLPPIRANEQLGFNAFSPIKFFTPDANWTWYASEFDGDDSFFGLVSGLEVEYGYFSLSELESIRGGMHLPIERDLYYQPTTLSELEDYERKLKR